MRTFVLRPGRALPLWRGHPWVHADSVAAEHEEPGTAPSDVALVRDADGRLVGRGLVSDGSALRVRLLDHEETGTGVDARLAERLRAAVARRRRLFPTGRTTTYRLVHAEGDGLPGLVVDRHGDALVASFATGPMLRRREALAAVLLEETGAHGLLARPGGYEREEGIRPEEVPFTAGAPVPPSVWVREEGMHLEVEPHAGQKTGHFADQRENRVHVAALAAGAEVLDLCAGTGGFSLQALRHGARASVAVESSPRAAATARRNAERNGVAARLEVRQEDVGEALAALKAADRRFDVVVLDPPSFFPRRGGSGRALRAYRELNVRALTRTAPGGILATFTCSARLPAAGLLDLVASASRECRRPLRVLRELAAGPDHPWLPAATEGRYLSGLLLAVEG